MGERRTHDLLPANDGRRLGVDADFRRRRKSRIHRIEGQEDERLEGIQMTRIAPLADVKARLSAYIEESQTEGPIVITRNGKAVAVLVSPVDDDDVESLVLARSPRVQRLLKKSRASIAAGRGLSAKEFWDTVSKRRRRDAR